MRRRHKKGEKNRRDPKFGAGGFTLVELVVSMFVFTTAITFAAGVFISGLRAERRLVAEIAGNNAVALGLETMAREIRVGYNFEVGEGGGEISFTNIDKKTVSYELGDGAVLRNGMAITGGNVSVESLNFFVAQSENGQRPSLCSPWRVTIFMAVRPKEAETTSFVETTVSSRTLPGDLILEEYKECRLH